MRWLWRHKTAIRWGLNHRHQAPTSQALRGARAWAARITRRSPTILSVWATGLTDIVTDIPPPGWPGPGELTEEKIMASKKILILIDEFDEAAREQAFRGAAPVEDRPYIDEDYDNAREKLIKEIDRLEKRMWALKHQNDYTRK